MDRSSQEDGAGSSSKELQVVATVQARRGSNEEMGESDSQLRLPAAKKAKLLRHEDTYLRNLPSCEAYEKSYMHRDIITHVQVTKTQFLITASVDGFIKFWKKTGSGIEFVKNFKSHAGPVEDMSVTASGSELVSVSRKNKSLKVFDVVNFDMINMISLNFEPKCVEWINTAAIGGENLVIADSQSNNIYTFDAKQSDSEPKRILDIHGSAVCRIRYNPIHRIAISADIDGNVKYWKTEGNFSVGRDPPNLDQADQYVQNVFKLTNSKVHNTSFSPDGEHFVTTSSDRKIRIFKFKSCKMVAMFDESLEKISDDQKREPMMNNMDFARRMAIERQLDTAQERAIFDQSGLFVLYPSMLGVKIYNWKTNRQVKSLGKEETNFRPLCISLFQGLVFEKLVRKFNLESLESGISDPTLFCSAHKKNRFYCFSHRYFEEDTTEGEDGELIKDRDIFNEKPTREEAMAAIELQQQEVKNTFKNATIHTTMGDIHLKLFIKQAPKACENFCVHSRNGYYNNHIFHRVIKQFMIQTGDPTGTGTGGESIWDDEFEDEFCDELNHDKPYTVSMANCGPNTNGSQFFITVAPCSFLDNKHTIFGRVTRGMDICQNISKVKTDPKTDKPYSDVKIINIKVF